VVISEGLTSFPNALTAMAYAKLRGIPFVAWDSGRQVGKPMPTARRLLNPIDRTILLRADACIGYSSVAREWFLHVGVPAERIFVAQNSIDVTRMLNDRKTVLAQAGSRDEVKSSLGLKGRKVILYVGAVERRKRLEDLFSIAAKMSGRGEPVSVLIVGDGDHLDALKEIAAATSDLDARFAGRRTDDVGRYFVAGDAFVLPGPGGLSINQAMAYGCAVVVRGGDGTEGDLIDNGVSGFLVAEGDSLAEPIEAILSDERLRERISAAALDKIAGFGLENMRRRFLEAVDFATSGRA
jgi:glycosyltransferase involved in cell wall biosynthesis